MRLVIDRRSSFELPAAFSLVVLCVLIGGSAATFTLLAAKENIEFAGGALRNGLYRPVIVVGMFLVTLLPLLAANTLKGWVQPTGAIKILVSSITVICVLGIVQFLVFLFIRVDIAPIGVFHHSEEAVGLLDGYKSATYSFAFGEGIRISSLAGEPKNLGMLAAAACVVVLAMHRKVFAKRSTVWATVFVLFLSVFLTVSTSAIVSLVVSIFALVTFNLTGWTLSRFQIFWALNLVSLVLLAIYTNFVMENPLTPYVGSGSEPDSAIDWLYSRSFGRIEVEDFDWVILRSMIDNPATFLMGKGFGMGHIDVQQYIPENMRYYMEGRVLSPKSGITFFVVNFGVVGLLMFNAFLASLAPRPGRNVARNETIALQTVFLCMFILMCLRVYSLDLSLVLIALLYLWRGSVRQAPAGAKFAVRVPAHRIRSPRYR
ncbi:MAG: hypothetical protein ACX94B_10430 [Henriciella sp.]